jgi:hypothetical protein
MFPEGKDNNVGGGTDISEEDKTFLLNVKWKVPNSDNFSSIKERLGNKIITWSDKETINSIIRKNSTIDDIDDIEHLKNFAGTDNMIKNDKFYYTSIQIMKWLRPTVGPSSHGYSAHDPNVPNSA